jgi:farnesyl diphosphate synthase
MTLAGVKDHSSEVEDILLEMGHFFQIQDDYLDCFGDPKVTGKVGTDIADVKCSWMFVKAVQCCENAEQKNALLELYGSKREDRVEEVTKIYRNLRLPQIYADYEENTYKSIVSKVSSLHPIISSAAKPLLTNLINKIFGRKS